MQQKTNAIVISSIKYADTSLIVHCYTEESGIRSYLLKGILKSKKGRIKKALFQPLTQLEIIANHNNKGHLNSIKEAQIIHHYQSIHTDIRKQSIVLFLSEVLYSCLREEETNKVLFSYLIISLRWLDSHEYIVNFHLLFLIQLTKYLGFYPEFDTNKNFFDLVEGKFVTKPISNYFIQKPQIASFRTLLGTNFDTLQNMTLTSLQRTELLDILIQYISLHLHTFKTPKSLSVLQSLFN
jgi:DNA repair protein RecO (recombination protein O)